MEPFVGQIQIFGFNFAPRGWAHCNGQLLAVSEYDALFSLLGTFYGGDGRTTFALPDFRGRAPLHFGTGPGLTNRRIGERAGAETTTIGINNVPAHGHPLLAKEEGNSDDPTGNVIAGDGTNAFGTTTAGDDIIMRDPSTGITGGGQAIYNLQPYLVVNYCIALTGIYPSRS